ncbi:MAG TPA: DUF29 family protein [Stellaceae bacterium]|nr:DUF29 family protein [Stellaceae bacterium]
MPDDLQLIDRHRDPYAWALEQAALLRSGAAGLKAIDAVALREFLDEWAEDMLSTVRSQLVNLMAHAVKAARSRNPDVVGHWRSECIEFHDRLVDAYRPSMRDRLNMATLWKRAGRKVDASFADHGEPKPKLPADCPFTLDQLIEPDLDLDVVVASVSPENASHSQGAQAR